MSGPYSVSGHGVEEKNLFSLQRLEPRFPGPSVGSFVTEQSPLYFSVSFTSLVIQSLSHSFAYPFALSPSRSLAHSLSYYISHSLLY